MRDIFNIYLLYILKMESSRSMRDNKSIAQRDKDIMDLQAQMEAKETQLKQDYKRLLRDVKHNPYLEAALTEYRVYFEKENAEKNKKIKALNVLLKHIGENEGDPADINEVKREIHLLKIPFKKR
jgi:hypothetical protein